ncbi:MAG: peptidoglycan-binding protein [Candidatus Omnitrophica bacterium]|nr:peptidoglycan-binding protein [Candidatus Omnitrophota bacterium]
MIRPIRLIVLFLGIFVIGGCATTQTMNCPQDKNLKEQLSIQEQQIQQLKAENEKLRQQVLVLSQAKQEVRMPTATEIQTALKNAGYYTGPIDGQIGPQTKEAIQKFQKANNLNPDGVVGSRTWQYLSKYLKK